METRPVTLWQWEEAYVWVTQRDPDGLWGIWKHGPEVLRLRDYVIWEEGLL